MLSRRDFIRRTAGFTFLAGTVLLSAIVAAQLPITGAIAAKSQSKGNLPSVSADGAIKLPPIQIPLSEHLSKQAADQVSEYFNLLNRSEREAVSVFDADYLQSFWARGVAQANKRYPSVTTEAQIAGVPVRVYVPKDTRIDDVRKVLLNLHGGAFINGWPNNADEESVPVASMGRIKVISVNYRLSPNQFPAASEDVAAVYKELLKTYSPKNIGIYGCSAGGFLTAESLAWFQQHNLPKPGAAGILCASAEGYGGGDADYLAGPLIGMRPSDPITAAGHRGVGDPPYFRNADFSDPLVSPISSDTTLSKFPATLIITSTRAFEISGAVYTHSKLVSLGVDAELHVWEGLPHGFYANMPDLPESQEAVKVIVDFFREHLGGRKSD